MPPWRRTALMVLVCAAGLSGCATLGERETAASRAALRFERSVRQADWSRACAALAPQTRQELTESAKTSCVKALPDEELPYAGALRGSEVYGQQAQVVLTTDTLFLSAFPTGWLITAAGCEPRPHQPYQCKVKGG
ncbi:hypothetical protein RQC66_13825 [Streptomyces justiciae]|uniref:Lipoprotein n=1 Tax=Streptomyces justiciae TaxID=2780140 RepID=A0ABU3LRG0_9ACTN|nr:hypothetical protein [Streptomyces justiciae]